MTKEEFDAEKSRKRLVQRERRTMKQAMRIYYDPNADARLRLAAGMVLQPEPMHKVGDLHKAGDATYRVQSDGSWKRVSVSCDGPMKRRLERWARQHEAELRMQADSVEEAVVALETLGNAYIKSDE